MEDGRNAMAAAVVDPFKDAPPQEVPLPRAPLGRVLAQLSFNEVVSIQRKDFIGPFQEEIRSRYPVLEEDVLTIVEITPAMTQRERVQTIWRFADRSKWQWRISLASGFVAIETTAYTSRDDFLERTATVAAAAHRTLKLDQGFTRIGVRYVDRVVAPEIDQLRTLVHPPMLGILDVDERITRPDFLLSQLGASVPEGGLSARWGLLPPNVSPEVSIIDALPEQSWLLDIDVFSPASPLQAEVEPVSIDGAINALRSQATRAYTFFRWATTDTFLKVYGGATDV